MTKYNMYRPNPGNIPSLANNYSSSLTNMEMMAGTSVIEQLIAISNIRAFPNQFYIKLISSGASYLSQNINFYATKISLGSYDMKVDRLNSTQLSLIKKASIPDTIDITIKEDHNWTVLKYFYEWWTKYYFDPNKKIFISGADGKKRTVEVFALKPDNSGLGYHLNQMSDRSALGGADNQWGLKIILEDALLMGPISLPSFSHEESKPIDFSFKLRSDNIKLEFKE